MDEFKTKVIRPVETYVWLLEKHYAHRIPSISWAFGLFLGDVCKGVCTFGKPASAPLCSGVCGEEYKDKVYELNRLVVDNDLPRNTLSSFVGDCLRYLRKDDLIIVSYADEGMNHCGYIYQATNWYYTGKTLIRTDKYMPGNKHPRHYTEEFAHLRKFRTAKYRYIYFTGASKKKYLSVLKYPIVKEYPKLDPSRYEFGDTKKEMILNTNTGETFYE